MSKLMSRAAPFAVLAVAIAAAGSANAAIVFTFSSSGFGVVGNACNGVPDCVEGFTVGDADDTGGASFPIAGSWAQFLNFSMTPSSGALFGVWSFTDIDASLNDLSGTFTGQTVQVSANELLTTLNYTVTAGSGLFARAIGSGQSLLRADGDYNYTETGSFDIMLVPEPATYALVLTGLGLAGVLTRRRKA